MRTFLSDIHYLIEAFLLIAAPFALMAAGVALRRRSSRFVGNLLLWSGVLSVLFCLVVALNYIGIF